MLQELFKNYRITSLKIENIEPDINVILTLVDDLVKRFVGPRCYKHRKPYLDSGSKVIVAGLYKLMVSEVCMFQKTDAYKKVNVLDVLIYIGGLPMNEYEVIPEPIWFKQADYALVYPAHTDRLEILSQIEYDFGITIKDELE